MPRTARFTQVASVAAAAAIVLATLPARAAPTDAPSGVSASISAPQLFQLAAEAEKQGDFATAERAYRALLDDPDAEYRTEARFRLALLLADKLDKPREAAILLRRILDEKPDAARVRLELARLHARMGNRWAAERELRAVQAMALPPQVEAMVRFYAQALSAEKRLGGSVEVALAPDSNINRATRTATLGTVFGDFVLDEDARAKSGTGLALRAQAYGRIPMGEQNNLLMRISALGNLYRKSEFNDVYLSLQAGPELRFGTSRLTLSAGPAWRWFGNDPYSRTLAVSALWQVPMGPRAQLRTELSAASVRNRRNSQLSGANYTFALAYDRAFSSRFGGGVQVSALRQDANDPGYAATSGSGRAYLYREFGSTTGVVSAGYSHLQADERMAIFPKRRIDNQFTASVSATLRSLAQFGFAPFVRLSWERNRSSVEIYQFMRKAAEFGLTSAF